jgi:hypothetical protein
MNSSTKLFLWKMTGRNETASGNNPKRNGTTLKTVNPGKVHNVRSIAEIPIDDPSGLLPNIKTPLIKFGFAPTSFTNSDSINLSSNSSASQYPAAITASGLSGTISSVTVEINGFTATSPSYLAVVLVSPVGQNLVLMNNVSNGSSVSGLNLTIDDAELSLFPGSGSPFLSGTYKPMDIGGESCRRQVLKLLIFLLLLVAENLMEPGLCMQ